MNNDFNVEAAKNCLTEAVALIRSGALEDVIRHRFSSHLPSIFREEPSWIVHHGHGTEYHLKFAKAGKNRGGFVDALVGLTAIEYEKDISQPVIFEHGLGQVKDYCAGLLNMNHPADLIIGVLSDTVRWRAYRIATVEPIDSAAGEIYGRDHVHLDQIEEINLEAAGETEAMLLAEFLARYLGREGARPLGAETLAGDLGFDSRFCTRHIEGIKDLVDSAFRDNPKYAGLIEKLWGDFVAYLGDNGRASHFDKDIYIRELYILTLAKLLCANVIAKSALNSSDGELRDILNGEHFKLKGLSNLVEYDYFGWLNNEPYVDDLLPISRAIQDDLRAYDFRSPPAEDLFGATMAQLARHSHRLLLGQEWTPAWLASEIVENVFNMLPTGEDPRLVDMCCGSGAMVVEVVKRVKRNLDAQGATVDESYISRISYAITGFDIDPLAVMLSKVGWVIAARDRLEPFGSFQVSIPIYHADSLFAITPLSQRIDEESGESQYNLVLDDQFVVLPSFLVSPEYRALFDALLSNSYEMAMVGSKDQVSPYRESDISSLLDHSVEISGLTLSDEMRNTAQGFTSSLITALDTLQRDGRNGIWAFVIRNSYRPGLVVGLFNGLVSNPPWLALSKIADNPYKHALRQRAESRGIKPPGPSHLHIELATIFLLHSIDHYLQDEAVVGCVLPETILNGHHHNPFRQGAFLTGAKPVPFSIDEIWRVAKGAFKNEAIVLFGQKVHKAAIAPSPIPGKLAKADGLSPLSFNQITLGNRIAWSDRVTAGAGNTGFFNPADFRQGADLMPRTLVFHETSLNRPGRWNLGPIDRQSSSLRYLVGDAKKLKDFSLPPCVVSDRFVFDVLMSNHLTPFDIASPAKGLLPIEKNADEQWVPIRATTIAAHGAQSVFRSIFAAAGPGIDPEGYFAILDSNRRKLTNQSIPQTGWLVFMGASGSHVCAAYADATLFAANKLVIDQTLYWAPVQTEYEAIYLTGLLNSQAIDDVIKEFQPRGLFTERHVHKLPLGVTPKFDAADAAHADVVEKTRALMAEWTITKTANQDIARLLDPNKTLASRRTQLRTKIRALAAYAEYELACRNLYGV